MPFMISYGDIKWRRRVEKNKIHIRLVRHGQRWLYLQSWAASIAENDDRRPANKSAASTAGGQNSDLIWFGTKIKYLGLQREAFICLI